MKRLLTAVASAAMLLTTLASPAVAAEPIKVGDCIVENTVDESGLHSVVAECNGVNISGLDKYPQIVDLNLRVVPKSLHVLTELPALVSLGLGSVGDTDPIPSETLKLLGSLNIESLKLVAPAQDLSALASMPKLRFLYASSTDFSRGGHSLKASTTLTSLSIGGGPNTDLSELTQLKSLNFVEFSYRFKEPVVKVGDTFKVPTFTGLDGKSFVFTEAEDRDSGASLIEENTFKANSANKARYMETYSEEMVLKVADRTFYWTVRVVEGGVFTATDVLKATKIELSPAAETVAKGTELRVRTAGFNYPDYLEKYSCEWFRNGKATGSKSCNYKLTPEDSNQNLELLVTPVPRKSASSFLTPVATKHRVKYVVLDLFSHKAKVTGATKVGSELKAETGKTPSGTKKSYRWMRDGKSIKGATKSRYTPTATDVNRRLSVKVSSSKSGFVSSSTTSGKTSKIDKGSLKVRKYPTVSGSQKVGRTLTAKSGSWSAKPDKYNYRWYRNGAAIAKATKPSYKLTTRDRGKVIFVKVTAHKKGYNSKTVDSRVR